MAQRAVIVLDHVPVTEACNSLARRVARQYSDDGEDTIIWYLDTTPPRWMNVAEADQLEAHKRDAGIDACYMTVIMCTDEEADQIYNEE